MALLLQIGIVFGALVAPGLLTVYLAREASPSPEGEPPAEATVLSALTIAIALIAVEFFVFSMISWANDGIRIWGGLTLPELVSDDPWSAVRERPGQAALIASGEYLAHLAALAAFGWVNPLGMLVRRRIAQHDLREATPFLNAILEAKRHGKSIVVWASAVLRDGRTYSGTLQSVSFRPLGDGSRELFMQSVERIGDGEREPVGAEGTPSGLVLNTRDVIALELAYAEVPSAAGEPAA